MSSTPVTPTPTPAVPSNHNTFAYILGALDMVAQMAELYPPAAVPASWADSFLQIAIKTNAAHIALFGKPLDLSSLKDYTPV